MPNIGSSSRHPDRPMSMIRTPHFNCAANIAFAAASYHRVSMIRVAGVWVLKVKS